MIIPAGKISRRFSVYREVSRATTVNIFTDKRNMLAAWCANIEKTVLAAEFTTTLFASFQQLEFFLPVADRYLALAEKGNTLYVFGEPYADLPQAKNLHYVHLHPYDALRKEWFLVAKHDTYTRALISVEISNPGTPHKDRTFTGALTENPGVVSAAHQLLTETVAAF